MQWLHCHEEWYVFTFSHKFSSRLLVEYTVTVVLLFLSLESVMTLITSESHIFPVGPYWHDSGVSPGMFVVTSLSASVVHLTLLLHLLFGLSSQRCLIRRPGSHWSTLSVLAVTPNISTTRVFYSQPSEEEGKACHLSPLVIFINKERYKFLLFGSVFVFCEWSQLAFVDEVGS